LVGPQREIYAVLGMTAQRARPALNQLKLLGYVSEKKCVHGRGRPGISYQVSAELHRRLEGVSTPPTAHLEEVENLCLQSFAIRIQSKKNPSNMMDGEERSDMLSPATNLLLAVLLMHAETPGVVRGLSYGRLTAFTGMTRDRLKSQISKLKNIGVIAWHQPGVLCDQGNVRMRSVYFLDLTNPTLMGHGSVGLTVLLGATKAREKFTYLSGFYEAALVFCELSENRQIIVEQLERMALFESGDADFKERKDALNLKAKYERAYGDLFANAMALLPSPELVSPASKDLLRLHRFDLGPISKAHIFSYVLTLLSGHWEELAKNSRVVAIGSVTAIIDADWSSLQAADGRKVGHEQYRALAAAIYALVFNVAIRLQQDLKFIEEHQPDFDFSGGIFMIKPFRHQGIDYFKLNVCFRASDGVPHLDDALVVLDSVHLSLPDGLKPLATAGEG